MLVTANINNCYCFLVVVLYLRYLFSLCYVTNIMGYYGYEMHCNIINYVELLTKE